MFQTMQFGCQTRLMISISSHQVKISGLYPLLHGFTRNFDKKAHNNLNQEIDKRKLLMLFTKSLTFVKFRIYGNLWEKKESSDIMFIFDPQCHTLVTFFFNLPKSVIIECAFQRTLLASHLSHPWLRGKKAIKWMC